MTWRARSGHWGARLMVVPVMNTSIGLTLNTACNLLATSFSQSYTHGITYTSVHRQDRNDTRPETLMPVDVKILW